MHPCTIPAALQARIVAMRGRVHPFNTLDIARCALIVVDMQKFFLAPDKGNITCAREIVPHINLLSRAIRVLGQPVVFTLHRVDRQSVDLMPSYYSNFFSPQRLASILLELDADSPNYELWPDIETCDADLRVSKTRFSALIPGSSDLHEILQARGVDTLIITGTATNVCCESTARDAMMMGYKVFFVADATAAHTDEEHVSTLTNLANVFADIRTTDEIVALLGSRRHATARWAATTY